jgi:preprotein translocase subunit SecD
MGCGLITLIASLLGIPVVLGAGLFMGLRTVVPVETALPPILATAELAPTTRLVYAPDPAAEYTGDALAAAVPVLERRLELLGIEGAQVMLQDVDEIVVLLPPVDDLNTLTADLVRPGVFELVEMHQLGDAALSLVNQTIDTELYPDRGGFRNARTDAPFVVILSNEDVETAFVTLDSNFGQWMVQITFNESGAAKLEAYTAAHIGVPIGIVVDGVLLIAPVINNAVSDEAVIQITEDEAAARQLAARIGGGTLPVPLILESIETLLGE